MVFLYVRLLKNVEEVNARNKCNKLAKDELVKVVLTIDLFIR